MFANDILEMSKLCKTAMATFVDMLYNLLFNKCVSSIIIVWIAFVVLGYKDNQLMPGCPGSITNQFFSKHSLYFRT